MPLSENEERAIADIQRHLERDDRALVNRVRRTSATVTSRSRRLGVAIALFVAGFALLMSITFHFAFGLLGVTLMFAGLAWGGSLVGRRQARISGSLLDRLRSMARRQDHNAG